MQPPLKKPMLLRTNHNTAGLAIPNALADINAVGVVNGPMEIAYITGNIAAMYETNSMYYSNLSLRVVKCKCYMIPISSREGSCAQWQIKCYRSNPDCAFLT